MIKKNIRRIADFYKTKHQEQKLLEEVGELIIEISSNMRKNNISDNTASEIADVTILLEQLKYLYNIEEQVNEKIKYKIDRQIKRISRRL